MELPQARANLELAHAPYRGGAASLRGLLGAAGTRGARRLRRGTAIREGRVAAPAVPGGGRIPVIRNAPSMIEQGFPDFIAATPAEIVRRMSDAIISVTQDETFNGRMRDITSEAAAMDSSGFNRFIAAERTKWEPIVRRLAGSPG